MMSGDDFYDDEMTSGLDYFRDPDYILDARREDLLTDPVPCAICGGDKAFRLVILAPEHIFHGPRGIGPVLRGVCDRCYTSRTVTA
jgi:hypothetical protein